MIEQKCQECGVKMWIATIDLMYAFDSTNRNPMRDAIKTSGIEHEYISLLKRRYKNQKATVMTDKESDMFEIKKGTKQGDPLPSLLFNTVLQVALKDDLSRWQKKKGMGICLGEYESASQLCDMLTMCSCLQLQRSSFKKRYVNSNIAQKRQDSRYIQEKRRFLATKARAEEKKSRLTTSKWKY